MITAFIVFVVICVLAVVAIGSVFAIIGGVLSLVFAPVAGIMGLFFRHWRSAAAPAGAGGGCVRCGQAYPEPRHAPAEPLSGKGRGDMRKGNTFLGIFCLILVVVMIGCFIAAGIMLKNDPDNRACSVSLEMQVRGITVRIGGEARSLASPSPRAPTGLPSQWRRGRGLSVQPGGFSRGDWGRGA